MKSNLTLTSVVEVVLVLVIPSTFRVADTLLNGSTMNICTNLTKKTVFRFYALLGGAGWSNKSLQVAVRQ